MTFKLHHVENARILWKLQSQRIVGEEQDSIPSHSQASVWILEEGNFDPAMI
jgi:hypothetical protein